MTDGDYVFLTIAFDHQTQSDPVVMIRKSQSPSANDHLPGAKLIVLMFESVYNIESMTELTEQIKATARRNYDYFYPNNQVKKTIFIHTHTHTHIYIYIHLLFTFTSTSAQCIV